MREREVLTVNTNIVNKLIIAVEIIVIIGNLILGFHKLFMLLTDNEQEKQGKSLQCR